ASEIGKATAQQFTQVSQSQVALLANGRVLVSTMSGQDLRAPLAALFKESVAGDTAHGTGVPKRALLGEEHYFCLAGRFDSLSNDGRLGYLLLISYEQSWQALRSTQQRLLVGSTL